MPHRWCKAAELRKNQIETGLDLTFNEVFKPAFVSYIAALNPNRILEVGAGTGHLSKELSKFGYDITAIEPSSGMHEVATEVLSGCGVTLFNGTLNELPVSEKYDVVLSHLVAHVIDDISAFISSLVAHVKSNGHVLFSIPHPCFYNNYKRFLGEDYNYMRPALINVTFNITLDVQNKISQVPYHHRPLSTYINCIYQSGLVLEKFEEVYPDKKTQVKYGSPWLEPRYCIFLCKKL